jgi:hypothetical protein
MRLKKFNELNEANEGIDRLTPTIEENVGKLMSDLKEVVNNYLSTELGNRILNNEGYNKWTISMKVPIERIFSNYVLDYIEKNGDKYNVKIHVVREERATMLEFYDEDSLFLIPIITTMHCDNMLFSDESDLEYGVWINKGVAKKVR